MDTHPGGLVLGESGECFRRIRLLPGEQLWKASDVKQGRLDNPLVVVRERRRDGQGDSASM